MDGLHRRTRSFTARGIDDCDCGGMIMRTKILACVLALAPISHGWAQVQDDRYPNLPSGGGAPGVSSDEVVLQALSERKFGVVIIDAVMAARQCSRTRIYVARKVDDQWQEVAIDGTGSFFGTRTRYAGMGLLTPGDYVVARVFCGGSTNYVLNGPFARFRVNGGEVVNLGVLVLRLGLARESTFGRWTAAATLVEGMDPGARSRLKERAPRLYARMVERRMTLLSVTRPPPGTGPGNVAAQPPEGESVR